MTTNPTTWHKRYALILYFVLVYAISWAFWIPISLAAQGVVKWHVPYALHYFGSFGPMERDNHICEERTL